MRQNKILIFSVFGLLIFLFVSYLDSGISNFKSFMQNRLSSNSLNKFEEEKADNYNTTLLNPELVSNYQKMLWSDSHIAPIPMSAPSYLGAGMLYYSIVQANLSKVAVVIGSGGGFVPQIIAHSQRDSGISDAITYYIDADIDVTNIETGQTYGMPVLDRVKLDKNLYLLKMRSSYAAKLFAKEGLTIDYLHIDGDHSIKGILEDWNYYYPLLSPNAIVTFHDYSSVPSVKEALKIIKEKYPDLQFLVFPTVGAGTVVAQKGGLEIPARYERFNYKEKDLSVGSNLLSFFKKNPDTHELKMKDVFYIREEGDKSQSKENLSSQELQKRYLLAKEFLQNSENILEISSYPSGMIYFSSDKMKNISVIDPFGTNYWVKSISYEAMEKQINLTIYPSLTDTNTFDQNQKYSVVWLGINLSYYNNEEIKRLLELLALSEKAVLEHRDDPSSEELWQFILKTLRPKIIKSEAIGDESDQTGHHKGKIYYIEGFNHIYSKLS